MAAVAVSANVLPENVCDSLTALVSMFLGTLKYLMKDRINSCIHFNDAGEIYTREDNMPLAIEAFRMAGRSALKYGDSDKAAQILAKGALLGKLFDEKTAISTTYCGLLQLLLDTNYKEYISLEELEKTAIALLGDDWARIVRQWGQLPDQQLIDKQFDFQQEIAENIK